MVRTRTDHDHRTCVHEALSRADEVCSGEGARLTDLRREVLEYVWRGHEAVKAYEILAYLSSGTRSAKPPTVYRTLRFLLERGLVHRLESLNAFVGCSNPGGDHDCQFFICRQCGRVREIRAPIISEAIAGEAAEAGFRVERKTIEVFGMCDGCDGRERAG
jgi:Fur family zinc uptake transcriptional regulator